MRKTSSLQLFSIDFDPKECKIGQSKIDKLPMRRHSTSHIPPQLVFQQELDNLKKVNCALLRENEQLKRQLNGYRQQCNTGTILKTEQKVKQYKDRIRQKMSCRTRQSGVTQCQTGLLSSKQVSMERSSLTISDYYDQYRLSQKVPLLTDLQDIAERFFKDYCDHYAKLKTLFDCLQELPTHAPYKRLQDLLNLYKLPLLYQKSPQSLLREVSKSKERGKGKGRQRSGSGMKKEKELCWQVLSPRETIEWTEALLGKVLKSEQMLKILRSNDKVKLFISKIRERF